MSAQETSGQGGNMNISSYIDGYVSARGYARTSARQRRMVLTSFANATGDITFVIAMDDSIEGFDPLLHALTALRTAAHEANVGTVGWDDAIAESVSQRLKVNAMACV